jgi:hypothetical protein
MLTLKFAHVQGASGASGAAPMEYARRFAFVSDSPDWLTGSA